MRMRLGSPRVTPGPLMLIAIVLIALLEAYPARALDSKQTYEVRDLRLEGLERTDPQAISELLPRPLPARYTGAELLEFSRRVKNLRLFDRVQVEVEGGALVVQLSRKTTLAPIVDFSTGETWKDTKATLGAIEHDVDGRATRLYGAVSYQERGFNFVVGVTQHPLHPLRWAQEYELYYASSGFRFEDEQPAWVRNRAGAVLELISPFSYGSRFQYELALLPYYEWTSRDRGAEEKPDSGFFAGALGEVIYDAYSWDDLVPSGARLVLEARPGYFTDGSFRGEARFKLSTALPLGPSTVLKFAGHAAVVNPGNPNHSLLLGSQQGVRGLPDSFYRNVAHVFSNLELRHAFHLGKRWYLQPALFTDAAVFQPLDSAGQPTQWLTAVSTGGGFRVLPTGMVDFLLRVDAAWIHLPEPGWLLQVGINQYF